MTIQKMIEKYECIHSNYETKNDRLTFWQENFKCLEQSVEELSDEIQKKYEGSEVPEDLPEDLRAKLENRREGLRLSAKSASRLLRKLNPDKPVRSKEYQVIGEEQLLEQLTMVLEIEQVGSFRELLEQLHTKSDLIAEELKEVDQPNGPSEEMLTDGLVQDEQIGEGKSAEPVEEPAEQIYESESVEPRKEYDASEPSELETSNEEIQPEFTEEMKQVEARNSDEKNAKAQALIADAVVANEETLEELKENIESVEKRFCNFIEKSVGPVLDGLYSGKKHGASLVEEIHETEESQQLFVAQWMSIYDDMLKSVTSLLREYSVDLYEPIEGEVFDENVQEPIAVIEDQNFKDEEIKEVVRFGLRYNEPLFEQPHFLIRPAQVIVVKNRMGENALEAAEAEGGTIV